MLKSLNCQLSLTVKHLLICPKSIIIIKQQNDCDVIPFNQRGISNNIAKVTKITDKEDFSVFHLYHVLNLTIYCNTLYNREKKDEIGGVDK